MSDEDQALDDFMEECKNTRRDWQEQFAPWPTIDHPFEMIGKFVNEYAIRAMQKARGES